MIIDYWALALALLLLGIYLYLARHQQTFKKGAVLYSALEDFTVTPAPLRARLAWVPRALYLFAALFLLIAFLDPHYFEPKKALEGTHLQDPTEGRVIFLALDQSGSMKEPLGTTSKIALLKAVMQDFVKERPEDLLGLVSFARTVKILAPPTLDHTAILNEIAALNTVTGQDQDGTAIGYAIYKTSNLIASLKEQAALLGQKAPYTLKGAVVIVVTDGLQDPNPLDRDNPYRSMELEQAALYAKQKGIKVYVVNIEPKLGTSQYLPNLKQMKQIAELTGGKFYHASSSSDLSDFVNDIDEIETSQIYETPEASRLPTLFKRVSYYPSLLTLAFLLLLAGAILDETLFRRSPC